MREDVLEFSRLQEVNAMRLFAEMLRSRVGSPLSIASLARDLNLSPVTLNKYTRGAAVDLNHIRTKDDAEVDFCLSDGDTLTHLIECKLSDGKPHRALARFAEQWPQHRAKESIAK